jgi:hypothetical protein
MLTQASSAFGIGVDLGILAAATAVLIILGGMLYPTLGH